MSLKCVGIDLIKKGLHSLKPFTVADSTHDNLQPPTELLRKCDERNRIFTNQFRVVLPVFVLAGEHHQHLIDCSTMVNGNILP